jgi:Mlc titration factor MtfA (ptsG expression regulator)
LLTGLATEERERLRDLSILFLHEKALEEAAGLRLDDRMRVLIALQACLPALNLGLDWYSDWVSVIVYPDEFVPEREWVDEAGVVWVARVPHTGEAWEQGPVILSWSDVESGTQINGVNVVLHEFAHKLDMRNGSANGHPPLHAGMSNQAWAAAFTDAYQDFGDRVTQGEDTRIDPYAAESPAEFFAVFSEAFFEIPEVVWDEYPLVYEQLRAFYRQDTLERLSETHGDC